MPRSPTSPHLPFAFVDITGDLYLAWAYHQTGKTKKAARHLSKVEGIGRPLDPDEQLLHDHVIAKTANFGRSMEA